MTYNLSRLGENLIVLQILNIRNGVSEHYNLLYKTMLNYRGYKTFSIIGYFLEGNDTEVNKTYIGHEWTWVVINGTSSAHVLKGFKKEISTIEGVKRGVNIKHKAQMIDNLDDEKENFKYDRKRFTI